MAQVELSLALARRMNIILELCRSRVGRDAVDYLDPSWLMDRVRKRGSTCSPKALHMKLFGEAYDPQPLVEYLEQKYLI